MNDPARQHGVANAPATHDRAVYALLVLAVGVLAGVHRVIIKRRRAAIAAR
jgi:hypothetical protein